MNFTSADPLPPKENPMAYKAVSLKSFGGAPKCARCGKSVYAAEEIVGPSSRKYHKTCLTCLQCGKRLDSLSLADHEGEPYCKVCYGKSFGAKGVGFGGALAGDYRDQPTSPTSYSPRSTTFSAAPTSPSSSSTTSSAPRFTSTVRASTSSISPHGTGNGGESPRYGIFPDLRSTTMRSGAGAGSSNETSSSGSTELGRSWTTSSYGAKVNGGGLVSPSVDGMKHDADEADGDYEPRSATSGSDYTSRIATEPVPMSTSPPPTTARPISPPSSTDEGSPRPPSLSFYPLPHAPSYINRLPSALSPHNTGSTVTSSTSPPPSVASFGSSNGTGIRRGPVKPGSLSDVEVCKACGKQVYFAERAVAVGSKWHKRCLKCNRCGKALSSHLAEKDGLPYCQSCYGKEFGTEAFGFQMRR